MTQISQTQGSRWLWRVGRSLLGFILGTLLFITLWHLLIVTFGIKPYILPSPQMTFAALLKERVSLANNAWVTVGEMLAGLGVGSSLAILLAGIFASSPIAEHTILPFAITLRSIPVVAIAPLITLIVGRGLGTSIVVATIVCFFPMLVNAAQGFKSTSASVQELLHVCGANRWQSFWLARFPFALPYLFTGLRSAAPAAVLGAMLAEWLTGTQGLGYLIINSASRRDLALLWAVIILSTLLALAVFWVTALCERGLVVWTGDQKE